MTTPTSFGESIIQEIGVQGYQRTLPATPAQTAPWPKWVFEPLRETLQAQGIKSLYSHQVQAAQAAWEGKDVVLATGTASGKSLGFLLPLLSCLGQNPQATALYLSPAKALGHDQINRVAALCTQTPGLNILPAAYDGDTTAAAKQAARSLSRLLFSNPDMLHAGILANHQAFRGFLQNLRFIIIDELHAYRGVFGAHVGLVLRRLLRICARYGAQPVVFFASATIAHPEKTAARLIGRPVTAVTTDGAGSNGRTILLYQPQDDVVPELIAPLVTAGLRTLIFVRSRRAAEQVTMALKNCFLAASRPDLAAMVAPYRAGFLPEDRRQIEQQLASGQLLAVVSTNALELGIDIGGLDATVTIGYPGTIASFWQQAGRAGRRGQHALNVFVPRNEPLDNFLLQHPEALLDRPVEEIVFNPHNPHLVSAHLLAAAAEAPLTHTDLELFGPQAAAMATAAAQTGLLRKVGGKFYPGVPEPQPGLITPQNVHAELGLRGSGPGEIVIIEQETGQVIGTIDYERALTECHPGAVYTHLGKRFLISALHLDEQLALATRKEPNWQTNALVKTEIELLDPETQPQAAPLTSKQLIPGVFLANADVRVSWQVTGYQRKSTAGELLTQVPLQLPVMQLNTRAVAYTIDQAVLDQLGITAEALPGSLHAAEHAAIGLLPLFATCDRWDLGGLSTALHPQTLLPTVFVYDGNPGGAGFADLGYEKFSQWLEATYETVRDCPCETGCPGCIQSPKCGNGNNPLDKDGAIKLLRLLASLPPG